MKLNQDGFIGIKWVIGLAMAALFLASCDSGSKGSDPQVEDSSSSGSVITSSSSAKSSSSTQINSSGSVITSSGSTQSSSSGVVSSSSSSEDACDEEGATKRSYQNGVWTKYICTSGAWVVYVASSSSAASSSSYYNMDSTFSSIENLSYGEFTDPRDNQTYKTIVVNPGKLFEYEIFAENLNYGAQVSGTSGQSDDNIVEKYCYNDDPWYCDHYFGGLYQWSEAMDFPSVCNDVKAGSTLACPDSVVIPTSEYMDLKNYPQHQGICPDGWHIMSKGEWGNVIGGGDYTVKSSIVWQYGGTNSRGLSILPTGYRDTTGAYSYLSSQAYFWLPQEHSTDINRSYLSYITKNEVSNGGAWIRKTTGMSVRCVKDHEGL